MIVLKEAYQKLGIEVVMKPLPGERALRTSNSGKVDGEVFRIANVQKRYKNLIPVPTSINVLQGMVFSHDKNVTVNGWQSLATYKIGGQVGIKFVERGTKGMNRIMVDTNEQLFKMLNAKRIDLAIAAHINGAKTISQLKLQSINILQPPVIEHKLYHYLHKKHAALVPKIDSVLTEMQRTGRIQQIRQDFLNSLWLPLQCQPKIY